MKKLLLKTARKLLNKFPWARDTFPHVAPDPCTQPVFKEIRRGLVAHGEVPGLLDPLLVQMEALSPTLGRYDALKALLQKHPRPHQVNYLLGQEEYKQGTEVMTAFPTHVLMDISNICTVECKFCKYTHGHLEKRWLKLEEIQQIEWLQYPLYLNFTAGTAEALSNPQFIPIFEHVHKTYPHLILGLLTNGRTLNQKVLDALEGRLHELHISMNASNEEDYDGIIANGSWSLFSKHMKLVKAMLQRTKKPWLQASFVKMRWNLKSALQELEFAVEHGAHKVLFHHYYPHYIPDLHSGDTKTLTEKFGPDQSLYLEKERSDEMFARVRERARELGVEVETPVPFGATDANITWGMCTVTKPAYDCTYPWTHMFMLWGFKSKREEILMCCGLANDLGVYFKWEEMFTKTGFIQTWNSPTMQAYRRTVNGSKVNPICALCRKLDRFAPGSIYPDQRKFFEFVRLPVPPHFKEGKWPSLNVISGSGGCN